MNTIQPWNPFKELELMQKTFGSFLNQDKRWTLNDDLTSFSPAVDISEDKEAYHFKFDLPDMKKEDIKIEIHDGVLVVSGQKKFEKETKSDEKKYHRVERSFGSFMRSFTLPEVSDTEQVHAEYTNGALSLKIAKKAAKDNSKSKQITIK